MNLSKQLRGRLVTFLLATALFLLNVYICRELFHIEYLDHMGSIEASFISIAHYAMGHWRDLTWFPTWYDGIPYQNSYPPFLHLMVASFALLRGSSAADAYHKVTALFYCLGPVAVFALALRLSKSRWTAFAAGAIYSSVSMSAWIIPAIATDLGGLFHARRLQAMVIYGEGPHVTSMTLLPLMLLALDLALERRRGPYIALAAVAMALTVLTNWVGAFAIVLMLPAYLIARIDFKEWRYFGWTAIIGVCAYGLAMPWCPPSTVAVLQFNAKNMAGDFTHVYQSLPLWGSFAILVLAAAKILVKRLPQNLQFAIFFFLLTAIITLTHAWWNKPIVPQATRYHLEMEMAFAMLVAFAGQAIFNNRPRWMAAVAIAILVVALIYPVRQYRRHAREFLLRSIDITKRMEWKTAQWLNHEWTGERVFIPGTLSFWLNAFSDVPQMTGGIDQAATNYSIRVAEYLFYTDYAAQGHEAEYSILWLKAFGAQAVGIGGPNSGEFYKPYQHPKKFEGVLEPLWRDGDDVIYRVGRPRMSLARIVYRADLVSRTPIHGLDVDPLRPYVAALDNPDFPLAQWDWVNAHEAKITANLQPDQVVSIQVAWHKGWHAKVMDRTGNGRSIPVQRDGIGLMYIDPAASGGCDGCCDGRCNVDMYYDGGTEMRVAKVLSALTAIFLLILSARQIGARVILKKSW